jgi:integrin beta 2
MTRCNGVAECGDASDEIGCASFTCSDGTMVLQALTCNGTPNCPDGSDETSCPAADAMPCANGAMVSGRRCDGVPQCPDGSDEAVGCASPICTTAIATPSASAPPSASASSTVPVPPPSGS